MDENKSKAKPIATIRCRERTDKDKKSYFFGGGKKESQIVDLSKVVFFIFEEADSDGNPVQKLTICEGNKHST